MRVGIVDIGSNTGRLLVADVEGTTVRPLDEARAFLGLGCAVARQGALTADKIDETALHARRFARRARRWDVAVMETLVTAPGRQGIGSDRLLESLYDATGWPVRVLSADEEGRLAWEGAVSRAVELPEVVGVVDVGGGSTEIVVGTPLLGPAWVRSHDVGSLRLTRQCLRSRPPTRAEIDRARLAVSDAFTGVTPPRPDLVLATGGTARVAARIAGGSLDSDGLERLVRTIAKRPAKIAERFDLAPLRAETLLAGVVILAEIARLLDRPLRPARGGLREGAALELAAASVAAA